MNKQRYLTVGFVLLCALLLATAVLAISSSSYALDWFIPLTSGGGGLSSSANFGANITIGQSATGSATSTNFGTSLGYWYGTLMEWFVNLPVIIR